MKFKHHTIAKTLLILSLGVLVAFLRPLSGHADQLTVDANGHTYHAQLAKNKSARAFEHKLKSQPVVVKAHDFEQMEKVGDLPWKLPQTNRQLHTKPGQIILYQGRQLSLYYHHNSWSLTPIAQINHVTSQQLQHDLGKGNVTIQYSLKQSRN